MFKNHLHIEDMQLDVNINMSKKSPTKNNKKMVMESSTNINNKSPNHDTRITSNNNDKKKYNKNHPNIIVLNHLLHAQKFLQNVTQNE